MLKVGFVEVLQVLDEDRYHQLADEALIPENLKTDHRVELSDPPYKNAPGCSSCDMSIASAGELYSLLRPAHEGAIRIAALGQMQPSTPKDHSPGLISWLSRELGKSLPQPAFFEAQTIDFCLPEEIPEDQVYWDGDVKWLLVNRYERDTAARRRCIKVHGTTCTVCGLALADLYGPEVAGLIHVHHLTPVSEKGERAPIDPERDLRPVCPNCHAVIHAARPLRSIEQVQEMMRRYAGAGHALLISALTPDTTDRRAPRG